MREIQTELFKGKEKEILVSIFGGEQKLKEEYPALYEDMVTAQNQAGNRNEEGRASTQNADFDGWEEFEKLRLFYDPKAKILTVKGKIHKSGGPNYLIARLKIWNEQGKTWTFSYAVTQCSFLMIEEKIRMERKELSGIQAEINYMLRVPALWKSEGNRGHRCGPGYYRKGPDSSSGVQSRKVQDQHCLFPHRCHGYIGLLLCESRETEQ